MPSATPVTVTIPGDRNRHPSSLITDARTSVLYSSPMPAHRYAFSFFFLSPLALGALHHSSSGSRPHGDKLFSPC